MSRKGNCWDNAVSETLFGSLKVERLHGQRFQSLRQAKDEVLAWLLWYNRQRMHSTLKYLSPAEFENRWQNTLSHAVARTKWRLRQTVELADCGKQNALSTSPWKTLRVSHNPTVTTTTR
jgi:hypothetical protein